MKRARTSLVVASLVVTTLAVAGLAGCNQASTPVDLGQPHQYEAAMLDQINALRIREGTSRLDSNACLTAHARERATQLPGATTVPDEPLPTDCGDFDYAGENVSRSDQPAHQVVATWADNDLQYPNLVDPQFEQAGVGCVGVSAADTTRAAEGDEGHAGMACSVIFQGYTQ